MEQSTDSPALAFGLQIALVGQRDASGQGKQSHDEVIDLTSQHVE